MHQPPAGHAGRDWLIAVLVCVVIHVAYGLVQPRMTLQDGLAWDATHYHDLARQFRDGAAVIQGPRPFAYRIGAAWTAAHLPVPDLRDAFLVTNLAFSAGTFLLLFVLLRRLVAGPVLTIGLAVLFLMHHQGLRLTYYYPVLTDPGAMFFSLLVLVAGLRRDSWRVVDTVVVTASCFVGVFFRETVMLAPACVLAASVVRNASWRGFGMRILLRSIPLVAGVAGIWITHRLVQAEATPYTFSHAVKWSWNENTTKPAQFLLAVALNAGLLIYVPLVCFRYLDVFKRQATFALCAYAGGTIALAFIGGWHTDRFVSWGMIAYLPLVGIAAHGLLGEGLPRWKSLLLLAPVTVAHLLANRVWLAIPDATSHALVMTPGDGTIHRVLFAAFGDGLSVWHSHSVGMGAALQRQIGLQCLVLLVFSVVVGGWVWWEARRVRPGVAAEA